MRAILSLLVMCCLSVVTFGATGVEIRRLPDGAVQPQVVAEPQGVLHVVYLSGDVKQSDVFYVRSTDEGATFSSPVRVNSEAKSAIAAGAIRGAQVAVSNGRIHLVWNASKGGHKATLFYTRSEDGGKTFEPQRVISGQHPGLDGGGSVAADESGRVIVAWHAPDAGTDSEEGRRIWVAESTDGGTSFSTERAVDAAGNGVCACCSIRAAFVKGKPVVIYRMARDLSKRNMMLIDVSRGTTKQLAEVKVAQCVMSTISCIELGDTMIAAWETNGKLEFGRLNDSLEVKSVVKLPDGKKQKYASVAVGSDGSTFVTWTENNAYAAAGELRWARFSPAGEMTERSTETANLPVWTFPAVFAKRGGSFVILY